MTMQTFILNLSRERVRLKLTQTAFAEALGIVRETYCRMEAGKLSGAQLKVHQLLDLLGTYPNINPVNLFRSDEVG